MSREQLLRQKAIGSIDLGSGIEKISNREDNYSDTPTATINSWWNVVLVQRRSAPTLLFFGSADTYIYVVLLFSGTDNVKTFLSYKRRTEMETPPKCSTRIIHTFYFLEFNNIIFHVHACRLVVIASDQFITNF